jgi:hypothetical protein
MPRFLQVDFHAGAALSKFVVLLEGDRRRRPLGNAAGQDEVTDAALVTSTSQRGFIA